jgi:thiaminase (transcriptional activator TenA)
MSNVTSYSRDLIAKAQPYIDAQVQKPFLMGLINGDLPVDKFEFWLTVDYPYLLNFIKVMAIGIAKADDPEDAWVFLEHIKGIQGEMLDHQSHAARIGLPKEELLKHRPSPLKYSYMIHQLAAAHQGGVPETQAAVLACQWGYGECCRTLIRNHGLKDDNPYHKWFEFHTSPIHIPSLNMSLDMLDRHADKGTATEREKYASIFMVSVQHETMLWDEYYNKTQWETH